MARRESGLVGQSIGREAQALAQSAHTLAVKRRFELAAHSQLLLYLLKVTQWCVSLNKKQWLAGSILIEFKAPANHCCHCVTPLSKNSG
jgi:hypothetical protein